MSLAFLTALFCVWWVMTPSTLEAKHRETQQVEKDLQPVAVIPGTPVISGEGIDERLSSYIKLSYPPGSISHRLGEPMADRRVSKSKRQKIIDRDGGAAIAQYWRTPAADIKISRGGSHVKQEETRASHVR